MGERKSRLEAIKEISVGLAEVQEKASAANRELSEMRAATDHEPKEVQVARISSRQAVTVALITALSGILVGALTGYQSGQSAKVDAQQRWITIKPLVADPLVDETAIRVIMMVNSQAYSYPSRAIWADIDPRMSEESFPLPIGLPTYRVRFEAIVRTPDGEILPYLSQEVQDTEVSSLRGSVAKNYEVSPVDGYFIRGGGYRPRLSIRYEIR